MRPQAEPSAPPCSEMIPSSTEVQDQKLVYSQQKRIPTATVTTSTADQQKAVLYSYSICQIFIELN